MDDQSITFAGLWLRTKAFALDYIVILGYLLALTLLFLILNRLSNAFQELFRQRVQAQFVAFLLVTLPVTLYFAISESSVRQATWGKRRSGLRVTDHNGNRIHFPRALARTLLKFIPWELSHTLIWQMYFSPGVNSVFINYGFVLVYVLIGLNIASLVMTKTHRTLYDFLAGTYVVK
jgi:uncharacterized RDD family membrane protein YckC